MSRTRMMQLVIAVVVMSLTGIAQAAVPVAYDCKGITVKNEAITLRMHFQDADGGNKSVVVVSNPAHGTLSAADGGSYYGMANGYIKYTPAAGYTGTDSFTWKINDGTGDSNVATTRILVREANDRAGTMVLLVVRDTLLPNIQSGINQLMTDLQNEGYTAKTVPFTVPGVGGELKLYNAIAAEYDDPSQFVTGAILIGNLPRVKNKNSDQTTDLVYWNMNRWFGNEDTYRNTTAAYVRNIWVSRIHASGVHSFNMPVGGEAELTLRALQNNHDYRTGASRYPHSAWWGDMLRSSSASYEQYFNNSILPNASLVWPTVGLIPGSVIDVLKLGSETINSTAHGTGDAYDYNDGHYRTSIYSIYESQVQTRFNVVESCRSGSTGGVVQQMPFTRGGGNILAIGATATTYQGVFQIFTNMTATKQPFRNCLAGGDSWGGGMLRSFPFVDFYCTMFYGDLSTGVKVAPENEMPEIGAMTASVTTGVVPVAVNFSASASDPDGAIANWEWWPYGYQGGSIEPISSGSSSTSYAFTKAHRYLAHLEVVDNYKARAFKEVELAFAPDSTQPMRFDCDAFTKSSCNAYKYYRKDGDYTDSQGNLWLHDQLWMAGTWGRTTGNNAYSTSNSITGTNDPYLYQQAAYDNSITYRVPVNNGAYILKLHFADINSTAVGKSVMDIDVEGATVVTGLDVYAIAGPRTVYIVTQPVTVTDGELTFIVKKSAGATAPAFISAFEVLPDGENQPPTVQIAAAANPNPTAGTTTALSVLGADDMGESNLTYKWETTGEPPAAVSFNINNSNAAKNTTATFSQPGTYNFLVTIKDSGNLTCTSSVEVAVIESDPPVLTTIAVMPSNASISTGETQQFTAVGKDQYGADLSPQPTFSWGVGGGGTIDGSGLFTAGSTAGGPYTVTASSGEIEGTASVTVTEPLPPPVLTTIVVTPSNAQVSTGETQQFTAVGKDQYGDNLSEQPTFSWGVGGGGTINGSGLFTAGATAGGPYTVTASSGGVNGTASVTVMDTGGGSLVLWYKLDEGAGTTAADSSGRTNTGTTSGSPTWAAEAKIDGGLNFDGVNDYVYSTTKINNPQTFTLALWFKTTTGGGKLIGFGSAKTGSSGAYDRHIYMSDSGVLYGGVYQSGAKTVNSGTAYNDGQWHHVAMSISAAGLKLYVDGQLAAADASVTSPSAYQGYWRVGYDKNSWTGSSPNLYFTGQMDDVRVYDYALSDAEVATLAHVSVLTTIEVTPSSASVNTGETQLFTAVGKDQYGEEMMLPPTTWSVSGGGTIDEFGLFTAGSTAGGPHTITATVGAVSGTAQVTVTEVLVLTTIVVTPSSANVSTGGTQQFTAVGKDQHGADLSPQPTFNWNVSGGGTIDSAGLFTAGATPGGPYTVTASSGEVNGAASVTVTGISGSPILWYKLDETSGTTAADSSGSTNTGTTSGSPAWVAEAKIDGGLSLDGVNDYVYSTTKINNPQTFTLALWFKTTTGGGKLIGFGSAKTGLSGAYDRHVYMSDSGVLYSGARTSGVNKIVNSGTAYNDGQWHHVAMSLSAAGMKLYVDGQLKASDASATSAEAYQGYWRVGYDKNGWAGSSPSLYFTGQMDDVRVYGYALSDAEVAALALPLIGEASGSTVIEQLAFYNQSYFDGNNAAANAADDAAVATDKAALRPGGQAGFNNYTSYSRGLNGIMVDILSLPGTPTKSDFAFKVGNSATVQDWPAGPPPISVTVRRGAGVGGSDRVTLLWPDNVIQNQWLQVTVLPTAETGLAANHVFYFGNIIGETGDATDATVVDVTDQSRILANPKIPTNRAKVDDRYDINRDGLVNATDALAARKNTTTPATALILLTAS